jgi:AraC-like DNA-binding protein
MGDAAITTSASTLRLFVEALQALGPDWRSILRQCGIDPAQLSDPDLRIPQERFESVWIAARESSADPCIGLHAGERIHAHAVDLLGYLLLSSSTLGAGLRRFVHYQPVLTGEPWVGLTESGSALRVRVGAERGAPAFRAIHAEYVAALVIHLLEWVSETRVGAVEARFEHEAACEPADYRRTLRCPVKFLGTRNEIVLDAETLERPSLHADRALERVHEEFGDALLARSSHPAITRRVRHALAERLEAEARDLASVARRLGMSARSLQRRLAEEETSFRALLDDARRELARHHLERRATPIEAIAYLTGFSEPSAFTRAVRRWFGLTPAQIRVESGMSPGRRDKRGSLP